MTVLRFSGGVDWEVRGVEDFLLLLEVILAHFWALYGGDDLVWLPDLALDCTIGVHSLDCRSCPALFVLAAIVNRHETTENSCHYKC